MKLIDILVRELPKRGGWPEGADHIATNGYWRVFAYWDGSSLKGIDLNISSDAEGYVTREQYEAALAASKEMIINKPDSDGWISWCGGECPVDGDVVVDVKFRAQGQADLDGDVADNFRWEHFSNGADVVAYRLHKSEHQKPQWDGDGLPPVGMEIEYKFTKVNYRTDFSRGKVLAYGMHNVFMEHWSSKNEFIQPLDKIEFRPIRSEADKQRDIIISKIEKAYKDCPHSDAVPQAIYEAIEEHIRID